MNQMTKDELREQLQGWVDDKSVDVHNGSCPYPPRRIRCYVVHIPDDDFKFRESVA